MNIEIKNISIQTLSKSFLLVMLHMFCLIIVTYLQPVSVSLGSFSISPLANRDTFSEAVFSLPEANFSTLLVSSAYLKKSWQLRLHYLIFEYFQHSQLV